MSCGRSVLQSEREGGRGKKGSKWGAAILCTEERFKGRRRRRLCVEIEAEHETVH